MRTYVGAGWHIYSLTDRVVWLKKADPIYWRLTGDDGFVKVRVEPDMTRQQAIDRAIQRAQQTDAEAARRIAAQLIPSRRDTDAYRARLNALQPVFGVPGQEGRFAP